MGGSLIPDFGLARLSSLSCPNRSVLESNIELTLNSSSYIGPFNYVEPCLLPVGPFAVVFVIVGQQSASSSLSCVEHVPLTFLHLLANLQIPTEMGHYLPNLNYLYIPDNLNVSVDSVLGEGPATAVALDQDLTLRGRICVDVGPTSFG